MRPRARLRTADPECWFASWDAGPNAFCEVCRQRTPVLYATECAGRSEAACRGCARLAVLVVAMGRAAGA